jgi:hypothetical protein
MKTELRVVRIASRCICTEERSMETNLRDTKALDLGPDEDAEERAFLEHLRANGVRLATRPRERAPGSPVKQRPLWLAFIFRTLRRLRLYDD